MRTKDYRAYACRLLCAYLGLSWESDTRVGDILLEWTAYPCDGGDRTLQQVHDYIAHHQKAYQ